MDESEALYILSANVLGGNKVILDLSDGRALLYSLDSLLTLVPVEVYTKADADED